MTLLLRPTCGVFSREGVSCLHALYDQLPGDLDHGRSEVRYDRGQRGAQRLRGEVAVQLGVQDSVRAQPDAPLQSVPRTRFPPFLPPLSRSNTQPPRNACKTRTQGDSVTEEQIDFTTERSRAPSVLLARAIITCTGIPAPFEMALKLL